MWNFKSNTDYIKAIFNQFAKLPIDRPAPTTRVRSSLGLHLTVKEPVTAPAGSKYQNIKEQLLKIYKCGREAVKNKINIPAERIAGKNKFDDIEKTIMLLTLYLSVSAEAKKLCWGERDGLEIIAKIFSLDTIDLYKYFFQDSRLNRAQLFLDNSFREGFTTLKRLRPEIVEELLSESQPENKIRLHPKQCINTPGKIYRELNKTVIAQETAKKKLSSVAFQHLNRYKCRGSFASPRLNVILIGPTGCGKTYTVRKLAEILKEPIVFCDATQYTKTGYVGANVEEMLLALQKVAGKDPASMSSGIIYIDEIDKIAASAITGGHNDVSGRSVQEELLKILEGDVINYCKNISLGSKTYQFNVTDILFIASGAFSGIEDIISKRIGNKNQIGFTVGAGEGGNKPGTDTLISRVIPQDIISYGFIPEFISRFPNIITMDKLTRADFISILTNNRTSLIDHYKSFFARYGIEIEIPRAFIEEIADIAITRDLGARGLNAAVENFFSGLIYELLDQKTAGGAQKVNIMECRYTDQLKELFA